MANNVKNNKTYKPLDKVEDGIAVYVKYANASILFEGCKIIDVYDNKEYILYVDKNTDYFYYIKNGKKYYPIWA